MNYYGYVKYADCTTFQFPPHHIRLLSDADDLVHWTRNKQAYWNDDVAINANKIKGLIFSKKMNTNDFPRLCIGLNVSNVAL